MTVYTITTNKTAVNTQIISGDDYNDENEFLFSAIQGVEFSINVEFEASQVIDGEETPVTVNEVNANTSLQSVQFTQLSNNKINVTGTLVNILPGESINFIDDDFILRNVNINQIQSYLAIVRWFPPSAFSTVTSDYNFVLDTDVGQINFVMSQYVYWDIVFSTNRFVDLVNQGI
jgi:hypothetical protein